MKTLRGLVLRHGTTLLNEDNCFRGMLDPPLDDKGFADAAKAAEFLKQFHIERIISSPLFRAMQTAQIVSGMIGGIAITQDRALFPWQMGTDFYGRDKNEFEADLDHYIDNPDEVPTNGESLRQCEARVGEFFDYQLSIPCLTLYVTHTSDQIVLANLIDDNPTGRPETGEEVVGPGGCIAVYVDGDKYLQEPVFGQKQEAEFGS